MKPPRVWLIVTTVLFAGGALVGLVGAMSSFFLFDAPGSEKNSAVWVLFWSLLTFPVVCVVAIAAAWIAYALKRFVFARCISLLPLVNIIAGGTAMLWLEIANGGRFN
jgi:heme/copper-type cytochrome/quinol oxidase subunit 2